MRRLHLQANDDRRDMATGRKFAFILAVLQLASLLVLAGCERVEKSPAEVNSQAKSDSSGSAEVDNTQECEDVFSPGCTLPARLLFQYPSLIAASSKPIHGRLFVLEALTHIGHTYPRYWKAYVVDLETSDYRDLDGLSTGNPILSPNDQLIAYEKYDDEDGIIRADVWVMDAKGEHKRQITKDGRSKLVRWNSDSEVLIAQVEFNVSEWGNWKNWWTKTGEVIVEIDTTKPTTASPAPEESGVEPRMQLVLSPGENEQTSSYKFIHEGKVVFRTPYVITFSDWRWKPQVLWIGERQFLTVSFVPHSNVSLPPGQDGYDFSDGDFDLVMVDCNSLAVETLHSNVDWRPGLSISPDRKVVTFFGNPARTRFGPAEFYLMNREGTKKRELIRGLGIGRAPEEIAWSADSKFLVLIYMWKPGALYRVDLR